jgi:hypothetical protein
MLRKLFGASLVVAAMALMPSFARADFHAGNWELTLGGSGSSNKGITEGSFQANVGLGYFVTKDIEVAFRQSVGYSDFNQGTTVTANSRVAADYHFDLGNFKPFVGGNIGYFYGGSGVSDTWEVAPEAGVKYFLNSTTFAYGLIEYEIFFRHGNGAAFDKGSFVYTLGLGVALK